MSEDKICEQCGKVHKTWHGHPACRGHKANTDPLEPCSKPPKGATGFCRSHGANLPNLARAAETRLALLSAQGEIATLMRECDIPDQHPIDGLLECVRVSGAMMRLLTVKTGELEEEPEVREVLEENTKTGAVNFKKVAEDDAFWGLNKDSEMVPHVYVQLLKHWTEVYGKACKMALDAGIDERRIRLAEDTADTIFTAVSKAATAAGLTPAQMEAFTRALAKELRTDPAILELI